MYVEEKRSCELTGRKIFLKQNKRFPKVRLSKDRRHGAKITKAVNIKSRGINWQTVINIAKGGPRLKSLRDGRSSHVEKQTKNNSLPNNKLPK